jgi:hypothetical protein
MPYTEAIEKGLVKKLVKKKENKIENVKQTWHSLPFFDIIIIWKENDYAPNI